MLLLGMRRDAIIVMLNGIYQNLKLRMKMTKKQIFEKELLSRLVDVEVALSPENLSCDGEASAGDVRRRFRALQAERRDLITALGREPSLEEMYPRMNPVGANFPSNKD
jgi:hypothetical protein